MRRSVRARGSQLKRKRTKGGRVAASMGWKMGEKEGECE